MNTYKNLRIQVECQVDWHSWTWLGKDFNWN